MPTDGLFATLVIVSEHTGRADVASGTLTEPDGDVIPLTFSPRPGPATAVVAASGELPIIATNGTYRVTATARVKTGTKTFVQGATTSAAVTVDCTRP